MSGRFMPAAGGDGALREGFHQLVNARENPACLAQAREWLAGLLAEPSLGEDLQNQAEAVTPGLADPALAAFHAPVALLEGAWLQSLALAVNGQQAAVTALFATYLVLLGQDEAASPAFAYRGWLAQGGIFLPKATAWHFAQDPHLGAPALRFASLQLALGLHAADFFPETLGFTLAYLHSASPWRLPALPQPRHRAVLEAMAGHTQAALQAFLAEGGNSSRLRRGQALYQTAEAAYLAALRQFAATGPSLAGQVAGIFRRKLRFARGYHSGVKLGGRGLEDWFAEAPFDANAFLAAFAASPYAGQPFERLNAFGGPMFGVFDQEELTLIEAWLGAAREEGPADVAETWERGFPPLPSGSRAGDGAFLASSPWSRAGDGAFLPSSPWSRAGDGAFLPSPFGRRAGDEGDSRRLFHALLKPAPSAETLTTARRQLEKTLDRARRGRLPLAYSPQAFAEHIAKIHDRETARHKPFQPPPKLRREEYVFGIRQFAPAVLVDGCWLQHLGEAANQDSRIHRLLQRIHAEELGEGRIAWNHPKIYRDLLEELGINLPALETWAFARDPGFLDSAFDLPCHLLAISQFPRTYLPEILGLNLAIELSGLGAGYLRMAEELRHWHINPLIVTLHLSIDNLAGGHAAMACEAIQLYLDEIRGLSGDAAVADSWRRIWNGYLSLSSATRRFKWALILAFCRRFIPQRIRGLHIPQRHPESRLY